MNLGLRGDHPPQFPLQIPTRWVGEQHVTEDLGHIPTLGDLLVEIIPKPLMNKPQRLSKT